MKITKRIGLIAVGLVASTTAAMLPGSASAAGRYDFAYGGGKEAHHWQSSQWNPGTCTIKVDYTLAQQHPELNKVDSVVLSTTGLSGRAMPVSWGAIAPAGGQLLIRFVNTAGTGCPNAVTTLPRPGTFTVNVPNGYDLMVVTASEGTVQPWFSI